MTNVRFIRDVHEISQIPEEERARLARVQSKYLFLATDYYLNLIDWDEPNDALRRVVIPCEAETEEWGRDDPSNETSITVQPGIQHKYAHTVVLLASDSCAGQCRFCFRKRIFHRSRNEVTLHLPRALDYIRRHPEITSVLVTGGDAFMLSTSRIAEILEGLSNIQHVRSIRLGSKIPAYFPQRILDDPDLIGLMERHSTPYQRLYLMSQFNHPRELTDTARESIDVMLRAGVAVCNQTPVLYGINDDVEVLVELMNELVAAGAIPYYFFQCRPTTGNLPYVVPLTRTYFLIEQAKHRVTGLARRGRYTMSHERGKVEIVGVTPSHIYVRYHRAKDPAREGKFLVFQRDDEAYWYDDLLAQRRGRSVVFTGAWQISESERGASQLLSGRERDDVSRPKDGPDLRLGGS